MWLHYFLLWSVVNMTMYDFFVAFLFTSAFLEILSLDNIPLWPCNFFADRS